MKKIVLQFIAIISFVSMYGQPSYDNNPQSVGVGGSGTVTIGGFSIPAGNNRLLVVCAQSQIVFTNGVTGATFAGNAMTEQAAAIQGNSNIKLYTYLVGNSGTSTIGDIVVSGAAITNAGVWSYHNVDQTTPVDNVTSINGANGSAASSLSVSSEVDDLVCDCIGSANTNGPYTLTADGSQTQVIHEPNGNFFGTVEATIAASHKAGAASVSMDYSISPTNQFAHLGMNINKASAALPVELISFEGKAEQNAVNLTWETVMEENNEGFDIQRSIDGSTWEIIGFVKGNGTTIEEQEYSFMDSRPRNGINYYQLKQLDFDRTFDYSEIVSVDFSSINDFSDLTIAPNPVQNGELTLKLPNSNFDIGFVEIFNSSGQSVFEQRINNLNTNLDLKTITKGIYWMSVFVDGKRVQKKVIVQ